MTEQHKLPFEGTDYRPPRDARRLGTQHERVRETAIGWPGGWFTMPELAARTGDPAGSVERQIRYLRDPKFGGFQVEKRHRSGGTFEYRIRRPAHPGLFE